MAEQFLEPHTVSVLEHILEPQYNRSIGRAAAWADGYAHTDEGRFSYQWHWIDSHDYPPERCDLYYNRDCAKGGCVVSAIENQTSILRGCIADVKAGSLVNGANLTCSYALKWVSHFLGDIAQPLHASGRAAGGNFIRVRFGNVSTELHAVSFLSDSSSQLADSLGMGPIHPLDSCECPGALLKSNHCPLLRISRVSHPERLVLGGSVHVVGLQ